MNIQKFTQKSVEAINACEKLAYEYGNQEIEQEHLLVALLQQVSQDHRTCKQQHCLCHISGCKIFFQILSGSCQVIDKLLGGSSG